MLQQPEWIHTLGEGAWELGAGVEGGRLPFPSSPSFIQVNVSPQHAVPFQFFKSSEPCLKDAATYLQLHFGLLLAGSGVCPAALQVGVHIVSPGQADALHSQHPTGKGKLGQHLQDLQALFQLTYFLQSLTISAYLEHLCPQVDPQIQWLESSPPGTQSG